MPEDPWTKDDPEPQDFDEDLNSIDPRFVERHRGNRKARLRVIRTTGERFVDEHAEALKLLANDDPERSA